MQKRVINGHDHSYGTEAERIAFTQMVPYDKFIITSGTNSGNKYEYRGATAGWVNTHDATGAALITVKSDNTHPDLSIDSDSVTLAADNASEAGQVKLFNTVRGSGIDFVISGAGVETITIKEYLNAVGTLETDALMPINLATGALHSATALVNGSYRIAIGHGYGWHFQKSAAVETTRVVSYASTK